MTSAVNDTLSQRRRKQIYVDSRLDELPLSLEAFRVYCHLVRRAGHDGQAFPSYRSIAETCFRGSFPKSSIDSLRQKAIAAVKELISWNLVEKQENHRTDGSQGTNNYELTDLSEWLDEPTESSMLTRKSGSFRGNRHTKKADLVVPDYPPPVVGDYPPVVPDYSNEGNSYKGIQIEGYPIKDPLTPKGESVATKVEVEVLVEEALNLPSDSNSYASHQVLQKNNEILMGQNLPACDNNALVVLGYSLPFNASNKKGFDAFLDAYLAEKPSNFVKHSALSDKHLKTIRKLIKGYGDRSLDIFVAALTWCREQEDNWWRKTARFSLDNLCSNGKLAEYADKHFDAIESDPEYRARVEACAPSMDKGRVSTVVQEREQQEADDFMAQLLSAPLY